MIKETWAEVSASTVDKYEHSTGLFGFDIPDNKLYKFMEIF